MTIKEQIEAILKELCPTKDLSALTDIVEGGYLDSFELMSLIAALGDTFEVDIDVDEISPENFNSVAAMTEMVSRLKG